MEKTTLALPAQHPAALAFLSEARVAGRAAALAAFGRPGPDGKPAGDEPGGPDSVSAPEPDAEAAGDRAAQATLSWDPLSFPSSRALILEAENRLGGRLDELVAFADPPELPGALAEAAPRDIEAWALRWAAGYAQLAREASRRFKERGSGTFVLVIGEREGRGALASMAYGALRGLAEGLAREAAAPGSRWRFIALRDESGQPDLVARHVVKLLDETPKDCSKPFRFSGRSGLFGAR